MTDAVLLTPIHPGKELEGFAHVSPDNHHEESRSE
jgi:hypothetical protein